MAEVGRLPEPEQAVRHELTVLAALLGPVDTPVLATQWRALPDIFSPDDIAVLQSLWEDALMELTS